MDELPSDTQPLPRDDRRARVHVVSFDFALDVDVGSAGADGPSPEPSNRHVPAATPLALDGLLARGPDVRLDGQLLRRAEHEARGLAECVHRASLLHGPIEEAVVAARERGAEDSNGHGAAHLLEGAVDAVHCGLLVHGDGVVGRWA